MTSEVHVKKGNPFKIMDKILIKGVIKRVSTGSSLLFFYKDQDSIFNFYNFFVSVCNNC